MVVFLPSLLLSGIMFPASMLPSALNWVGRVFPATFALQSFYGLAYHMPTELDPRLSLLWVGFFSLIVFALAFWRLNTIRKSEQR
jgi:ABC-2 type transport system permease protein